VKHSPAPWSIHPYTSVVGSLAAVPAEGGRSGFVAASITIGSGDVMIADFKHYSPSHGYPTPSLDEMISNATLAIAAPELLAALEGIVRRAEDPALCDDAEALLVAARAAIAKAKGQA